MASRPITADKISVGDQCTLLDFFFVYCLHVRLPLDDNCDDKRDTLCAFISDRVRVGVVILSAPSWVIC